LADNTSISLAEKTMKPSSNKTNQVGGKPKPTTKQFDEAFDSLAAFLFEQYRKSKQEV
jgi:hypothetical protein